MKKKMRVLTTMLLSLALLVSLMPAALAATTVDPENDKGNITVTLKYGENPVPGIDITLYRVAEGKVKDNNLYFELLDAFKPAEGSGEAELELDGLKAGETAEVTGKLAERVSQMSAEEKENFRTAKATTDENGEAKFKDIPVGVYLVVQSSSGRYRFSPVLLYLPFTNDAGTAWEFAVAVNPKVSYHGGGGGGGTPEPPVDPDDPNPPIIIPDEDPPLAELPEPPSEEPELEDIFDEDPPLAILPQTGLLQWPIPVMAMAGLLLMALGLLSEQKRKAQNS